LRIPKGDRSKLGSSNDDGARKRRRVGDNDFAHIVLALTVVIGCEFQDAWCITLNLSSMPVPG
jgi:hypothetical protein